MNIWHRISFNASAKLDFLEAIRDFGIIYKTLKLPGDGGMMVFLDIEETEPHWAKISELITTKGAVDIVETIFTNQEIRNAG